jgi:uncharacterized protein (DUF2252 family)
MKRDAIVDSLVAMFPHAMVLALTALLLIATNADGAPPTPLERLEAAYRPYMNAADDFSLPMKIKSVASDEYKFWRGTKDLFFLWSRLECADWLADRGAYLPSHGDLHLGNIGTYACDEGFGKLAFGMVDFDDSATLPFQLELLQGFITFDLIARQNKVTLDASQRRQLGKLMLDHYRTAIESNQTATQILSQRKNKTVLKLLEKAGTPYRQELETYVRHDRFVGAVRSEKGKLKEILRPAMGRAAELAAGIADAIAHEPAMAAQFRYADASSIRAAIKDAALRTRLNSSGSQGLRKVFVLLERPFKGIDHDAIIYLKQEIPTAAERSGAMVSPSYSPGERTKRQMDAMNWPRPLINSWCDVGDESYWVSLKEPWSDEIDFEAIKDIPDLLDAAMIWRAVAGAAHREEDRFSVVIPRLTPRLQDTLAARSTAFLAELERQFAALSSDPEVNGYMRRADAAIEAAAAHP